MNRDSRIASILIRIQFNHSQASQQSPPRREESLEDGDGEGDDGDSREDMCHLRESLKLFNPVVVYVKLLLKEQFIETVNRSNIKRGI
jgi:hypothetical protein